MALIGLAFTDSRKSPASQTAKTLDHEDDTLLLRRRNEELEAELKESRRKEETARAELEKERERVRVLEDAEEMLVSQLGELEAEASEQARSFYYRIQALMAELTQAKRIIQTESRINHCSSRVIQI